MRVNRLMTVITAIALIIIASTSVHAHAQDGTAYLRAVHYLTGAPKLDIYVDGTAVLTNLGFQDATAYTPITPGKHVINFGVAGKTQGSSAADINLEAAAGDLFTFVFSGTIADKAPVIFITSETGLAKQANVTLSSTAMPLLFVQGSKDVDAVDVYVNDKMAGTAKVGIPIAASIPFGVYKLKVTAAGDATKVLKDTAAFSMNSVIGVLGLTGTADKLSLDYAYSTAVDASKFFAAQKGLQNSFDSFLKAVAAAKLEDTLTGPGPMTIFAPTDAAFAAVDAATLEKLMADPAAIGNVIKYHIIGELVVFDDIGTMAVSGEGKKTLQGSNLTIQLKDAGFAFGTTPAILLAYNIHAPNAVIHLINAVLMPPTQ